MRRSRVEVEGWKPKQENAPALTKRKQADLAWANQHLPGEHPPYVVAAMDSVRVSGREPTPGAVMDRLRAVGRDRTTRVRKERAKGIPQGDDAA